MISTAQSKSLIRKQIRQKRQSLSLQQANQAGISLAKQLSAHLSIQPAHKIACFLSFDREIATQSVIQQIFNANARCYLPKLRPLKPYRLWFMPYFPKSPVSKNHYGIDEVDQSLSEAIRPSTLDIVLMPLVAFDRQGNRLGMGAGYYDATFAHLAKSQKRPKFIGLAYEFQRQKTLPFDPWDIPLDGVCTEQGFYDFVK
ncbi:MAG: 5-formyltetrahydrofolate cyclo-ligase [Enterobacterales bacterium]|nr:5-formyltetrahydrofolate cyclo-ligase [Enterobacterales bacterium]